MCLKHHSKNFQFLPFFFFLITSYTHELHYSPGSPHHPHTTLCYPDHSETSSKGQNSIELLIFLSIQGIYFINWALYFNSWILRAYYKWKKQIIELSLSSE